MAGIEIVEVAPRDGFQAVRPFIPTETKMALIEELAATGVPRLEIGSFVSPKALPQMADTPQILKHVRLPAGTRVMALVPNARGLSLAVEAGVREVNWVISVTESHNRSNVNRSVEEILARFRRRLGAPRRRPGCSETAAAAQPLHLLRLPLGGARAGGGRRALRGAGHRAAPEVEIAICDTTGRAATNHVGALLAPLLTRYASERVRFAFHGHDTYGLGVANALEAYRQGVRIVDGAAGGLGGCPFAPGAAGNTASEDLVFAFEHMGVSTGVDLARLLAAADRVAAIAPDQSGGKLRAVPRRRALSGFGAESRGIPAAAAPQG